MGIVVSWKILMGYCAILEVLHRIFGSFLWDFLHLWKFLMGLCKFWKFLIRFCALLDVPRGLFWKFSVGFCAFWNFLMGFCAYLAVPHGILCIFESSSWDFVHFWKFLMAKHTRVPNTDKVDAEEADHSICLAKMSLIRTKPDHFYDMIFLTYIFF